MRQCEPAEASKKTPGFTAAIIGESRRAFLLANCQGFVKNDDDLTAVIQRGRERPASRQKKPTHLRGLV
ncbi:hypothetical protein C5L22_11595 [Pantoea ananatis]|jgi:hypothetical protein|nr:hypothetical protein B9D02_17000 [Pantoea vagans]PQL28046.1 hypothetical protein C5L22_11595 [Pantoea ananatis]